MVIACPPAAKVPPKSVTPPSLNVFYPPQQSSNSLLLLKQKQKHKDVKLMHKPLIQHNSWQIKKQ